MRKERDTQVGWSGKWVEAGQLQEQHKGQGAGGQGAKERAGLGTAEAEHTKPSRSR